ncbi:uncharacterized protein LOC122062821 [Macadamia integrifolia]|uniref:uncharacterized protein LOC122062821 n=1 Tax=Macadamia integrifolia TaxID=60698 RepID=UPI001C4F2019|nr:uncharacterized protein LOC122062821 [Macadamia integrifolia]
MSYLSWLRQSMSWKKKNLKSQEATDPTCHKETAEVKALTEDEEFGVTEQLKNFVKSFSVDTFKNFPLQDDQRTVDNAGDSAPTTSSNVQKDLSEWQERHAIIVLSRVKEISQLRYILCPRYLKERQFWRIYFKLVKDYVAPYEIRAIQRAKLKRMGMEDGTSLSTSAYEVEMAEANPVMSVSPPAFLDNDSDEIPSTGVLVK